MMKKYWNEWKIFIIFFASVILLAFAIRVINLTLLPVFADEAIYIRWAQVMRAEPTLRFLPLSDGKQPLFMWGVMPMLKLFSDPLFAGRFLSVITGLTTLVGVSTLSYLLFKSKKASIISGLIYAISPYSVMFDRLALADSMLAMFGIWAIIFAYLTVRYLRIDTAMISGFILGGASLTKSPALFFALLMPVTLIFSKSRLSLLKSIVLFSSSLVIAFGIYNILRLGPNFHLIGSRNLDYVHPYSHILSSPFDPLIPHFDRALEWIRILGPEVLIFLIAFGVVVNFPKFKKEILLLLAIAFLPILIQSAYAKVFTARYIFFTLPFLYVIAGSSFTRKFKGKWNSLINLVLFIFVIQALWQTSVFIASPESARLPRSERSGYLEEWTAGTGIKEIAEYIKNLHNQNPDRPIVIGTEGYFGTLPDGLQIYLEKIPNVTVIGIGLDIKEVPVQLIEARDAGSMSFLVLNTSRMKFEKDFESYGLEVIEKYKKADRPEGIREYDLYGQFDYLYFFRVK